MPTEDITSNVVDIIYNLAQKHSCVFPVPEDWCELFRKYPFNITWDEGDSDYVYNIDKIATFKGQALHNKKNLLNQFMSLYTPSAKPLTHALMADARHILDVWQEDMGEDRESTDYFPCAQALELYDQLVLCGGIYYVDDEPAGFIIGEEVNNDMFALHFAKGKRKFKGMYQYMFNHFANLLPTKYAFLNFEQDMGRLALRIAKSSYHPDQILKKFRVQFVVSI
ncbi:MAG: phosphatidylglycerol lysyltransferase domain-containing protein [Candidatus Omnitrophota bacterium]